MLKSRDLPAHAPSETSDYAELMLRTLDDYRFPAHLHGSYDPAIQREIDASVAAFRDASGRYNKRRVQRILVNDKPLRGKRNVAVKTDQQIWAQVRKAKPDIDFIEDRILALEPGRGRISALIALRKLLDRAPARIEAFLGRLAEDRTLGDPDLAEWARISLQELALMQGAASADVLGRAVSDRPVRYTAGRVFDVTMPLFFECRAITQLGRLEIETQISPLWFTEIFGDAMAMIRARSFSNRLVLEKEVSNLHPDGSMHYEHFPFFGETRELTPSVHEHNYWASVQRPFYASGKVEDVDDAHPVYRDNAMTFFRLARTFTHARYAVEDKPMPESVRGLFFGFGHAEPELLIKKAGNLGVGDFQISPRINPHTGEPANTIFFGTFFGKLQGLPGTGEIALNEKPVHCDAEGRLDYHGDGSMAPDPIRPDDWH
ncbi:hypothetical protein [Salinarimonas sp.]|uniref:hypothetical protein n=1 Tax=Salinarimonas sp. TaxID=2766526 RepID=UPI0032D925CA